MASDVGTHSTVQNINHFNIKAEKLINASFGQATNYESDRVEKKAPNTPDSTSGQTATQEENLGKKKKRKEIRTERKRNNKVKVEFIWKTDLEQLLSFEAKANALMSQGDYSEAKGILSDMGRFPDSVRDVKFKFDYCASLMLTEHNEHVSDVFNSLVEIVRDNLECTFLEVMASGKRYLAKDDYIFAILLFKIAAEITDKTQLTALNAVHHRNCMTHMAKATDKLIKKCDKARPLIRKHVIPTCHVLIDHILGTPCINDTRNPFFEVKVTCFHSLEIIQHFANNHRGRIKTLKHAISFMEGMYEAEEVTKRKYYGTYLHNLASAYLHLSQASEAKLVLQQALECFEIAIDFDDEIEKMMHMEKTKPMLDQRLNTYC